MKRALQMLLVGAVIAAGVGALARAADATDSVVGTWTLNLAKSKYTPGPAPKSQTRTYAETADGISLTVTGVAADGSPISQQSTFKYDGKKYAITGSPDYDTLSLTRVNASTVKSQMLRADKHVGDTTRSISHNGKVLTLATKGTNAQGKHYDFVAVFDKQ
jgi:type IV secretory pathway VirJ component